MTGSYRITRVAIRFIFAPKTNTPTPRLTIWCCRTIYRPDRLKLNVDWAAHIPGFQCQRRTPLALEQQRAWAQVRQTILPAGSRRARSTIRWQTRWRNCCSPSWSRLTPRYALPITLSDRSGSAADKLIARLAGSLVKSFVLEKFCEQEQQKSARCASSSTQTGMTVNHYLVLAAHLPRPVSAAAYGAMARRGGDALRV